MAKLFSDNLSDFNLDELNLEKFDGGDEKSKPTSLSPRVATQSPTIATSPKLVGGSLPIIKDFINYLETIELDGGKKKSSPTKKLKSKPKAKAKAKSKKPSKKPSRTKNTMEHIGGAAKKGSKKPQSKAKKPKSKRASKKTSRTNKYNKM